MTVQATTSAGQVTSGTNEFTLAGTPQKPSPAQNNANVTNST